MNLFHTDTRTVSDCGSEAHIDIFVHKVGHQLLHLLLSAISNFLPNDLIYGLRSSGWKTSDSGARGTCCSCREDARDTPGSLPASSQLVRRQAQDSMSNLIIWQTIKVFLWQKFAYHSFIQIVHVINT